MIKEGAPAEAELITPFLSDPTDTNISLIEKPHEINDECGVVGVWAPGEAVLEKTIAGMEGLQHRGHSGAGIAYILENITMVDPNAPKPVIIHKGAGRVKQAMPEIYGPDGADWKFNLAAFDTEVGSPIAVGHTRYSTSESEDRAAIQPLIGQKTRSVFAHNGEVGNMSEVAWLHGVDVSNAASDSDALAQAIDGVAVNLKAGLRNQQPHHIIGNEVLDAVTARFGPIVGAMYEVLPDVEGAYCSTVMDGNQLIGARDPWGFHPLALGALANGKGYVLASENIVFEKMGAEFIRDIQPGEIVVINETGVNSLRIEREEQTQLCAFEGIYTSKEDSIVDGISIGDMRENLGYYSGLDNPVDADIVVDVPATGTRSAKGYALATGLPLMDVIEKRKGAPRTFQLRGETRQQEIPKKYIFDPEKGRGKRWVLFDDSMIKGHTMKALVDAAREAGATEVHVRLSSARYISPCRAGMDTHDERNLIAAHMTDEQIATFIGADSVAFNTPERIQQAADAARVRPVVGRATGKLCMSCATGEYPFSRTAENSQPISLGLPAIGRRALVAAGW